MSRSFDDVILKFQPLILLLKKKNDPIVRIEISVYIMYGPYSSSLYIFHTLVIEPCANVHEILPRVKLPRVPLLREIKGLQAYTVNH